MELNFEHHVIQSFLDSLYFLQVCFVQDILSIINVFSIFDTLSFQIFLIMYGDMTKTPVGIWPLSTNSK
jgi:hypothetical protein